MLVLNRRGFCYGLAGSMVLPRLARSSGQDQKSTLDEACNRYVANGNLPMVVAGITDPNGTVYEGAFGRKSAALPDLVSNDSVFYLASMTKPLTSLAAMQLVEQGRLKLDDPVARIIEDANKLQVLEGFDDSGKPVFRKPTRELTLRQLLTHTSGFGHVIWDQKLKRYADGGGALPVSVEANPESWLHPLVFDPGTRWEYSSVGIDWVGRLVAAASGKSLGSYMHENVLVPLGMSSTAYEISADMEARRVDNHQRKDDGSFEAIPFVPQKKPVREYGSGGLYGTSSDYLKFIRMMLNKGKLDGATLLKPDSVEQMARNNMGSVRVEVLRATNHKLSLDVDFLRGLEKTWGLGFNINERATDTGRTAGSLAWAGLFNTHFWIDMSKQVGGTFMTQILPFMDPKAIEAFNGFEKTTYTIRS